MTAACTRTAALLLLAWLYGQAVTARAEFEHDGLEFRESDEVVLSEEDLNQQADGERAYLPTWDSTVEWFPATPLWRPPIANQREPRLCAKQLSLGNRSTLDTTIGEVVPLARWRQNRPWVHLGEFDLYAAVFTRIFDFDVVSASDFRAGLVYTCQRDRWTGKVGFEHTSCHLIDEFIIANGQVNDSNYCRDDLTLGLSHSSTPNRRVYFQADLPVLRHEFRPLVGELVTAGFRCKAGAEWFIRSLSNHLGLPYVALDVDSRSEQGFEPNLTLQTGWEFPPCCGLGPRVSVEYYRGKSPYGQFLLSDENWIALAIALDR